MAKPILTAMRESIVSAVTTWPELEGVFSRVYTYDDSNVLKKKTIAEIIPSLGELPALAVIGGQASSPWADNQGQQANYNLAVVFWTPFYDVRQGERLWQYIMRALWQGKPQGSTLEYWRAGAENMTTGDPAQIQIPAGEGVPAMTQWTIPVSLEIKWSPRQDFGLLD